MVTWGSVCGAGTLLYLKIVANEFERASRSLNDFTAFTRAAARARDTADVEAIPGGRAAKAGSTANGNGNGRESAGG